MDSVAFRALHQSEFLEVFWIATILLLSLYALILLDRKVWDRAPAPFGQKSAWLAYWTFANPISLVAMILLCSGLLGGLSINLKSASLDHLFEHNSKTVKAKVLSNESVRNSEKMRVKLKFKSDGKVTETSVFAYKKKPGSIVRLDYIKGHPEIARFPGAQPKLLRPGSGFSPSLVAPTLSLSLILLAAGVIYGLILWLRLRRSEFGVVLHDKVHQRVLLSSNQQECILDNLLIEQVPFANAHPQAVLYNLDKFEFYRLSNLPISHDRNGNPKLSNPSIGMVLVFSLLALVIAYSVYNFGDFLSLRQLLCLDAI